MSNNIKNKILTTFPQLKLIEEGTIIKINSKSIMEYPNYNTMMPKYKEFVEKNIDTFFISYHTKYDDIVEVKDGDCEWYFWIGDLIVVEESEEEKCI